MSEGLRMGFGTSALMSRVNRRDSVRLLEAALDSGITHMDTARSYGFGEAELAIGDVLAGRRDRVTVATKMGILPPPRTRGLRVAKAAARGLLAVVPGLRARVRQQAGSLVQAGQFEPIVMQASLEASLRQLRTDYVDVLLLHEPSCEVLRRDEPLEFLRRVQREGKVRQYGIAATRGVAHYALRSAPEFAEFLQTASSVFEPFAAENGASQGRRFTWHSVLGTRLAVLGGALRHDAAMRAQWSRELEVDAGATGMLERMALSWALQQEPQGMVLFTSTKVAHVRENAATLRGAASPEQVRRFEQMVRAWSGHGSEPGR